MRSPVVDATAADITTRPPRFASCSCVYFDTPSTTGPGIDPEAHRQKVLDQHGGASGLYVPPTIEIFQSWYAWIGTSAQAAPISAYTASGAPS
jgi:hypothetical protein